MNSSRPGPDFPVARELLSSPPNAGVFLHILVVLHRAELNPITMSPRLRGLVIRAQQRRHFYLLEQFAGERNVRTSARLPRSLHQVLLLFWRPDPLAPTAIAATYTDAPTGRHARTLPPACQLDPTTPLPKMCPCTSPPSPLRSCQSPGCEQHLTSSCVFLRSHLNDPAR